LIRRKLFQSMRHIALLTGRDGVQYLADRKDFLLVNRVQYLFNLKETLSIDKVPVRGLTWVPPLFCQKSSTQHHLAGAGGTLQAVLGTQQRVPHKNL
jgi:hypothetical protein